MQGWRFSFFGLAASVACSALVACGGGSVAEAGAQSASEVAPSSDDLPSPRQEAAQGFAPVGTGTGTLRDFTLQVGGVRLNAPVTINAGDDLRLLPDASGALTSVIYWGDGASSGIKGGWNTSTPTALMSHRYSSAGSYQIEYATHHPSQGWDARFLQVTGRGSCSSPPPPTGTITASGAGNCSSSSRATVPCPAITRTSLYG